MRFSTGWRLTGTDTLRLASGKLFGKFGGNAQNPSSFLMRAMIPDEGKVFIQPDQSGAEALIVAYEAPPGKMLELFQLGIKPHTYTALQLYAHKFMGPHKELFHIAPAKLKVHPEWPRLKALIEDDSPIEYSVGKMVRHAKNYDMKGPTFATNALERSEGEIVLSPAEATRILKDDDAMFPELLIWHHDLKQECHANNRTLLNLFGYPRYFGGRWSPELERKIYAFRPQSTVGTITNLAYVEMQDFIERTGRDWDMLNNKHDSFLMQVPIAEKDEAIYEAKKRIERELVSTRGVTYRMRSGVSVGYNWDKWHPKKNPDGMRELK